VVCVYFVTSSDCLNFIWNKSKIKISVIVFNINSILDFELRPPYGMFMMLLNTEKGYLKSIVISVIVFLLMFK